MNLPYFLHQRVQQRICTLDFLMMHKAHQWSAPRWVRLWMLSATRGGDGWLWYAMAMWVFLFGGDSKWQTLGSMASAISVGIALFIWLKKATGRKRPCHIQPHCWSTLLPPDQFSFPSGHTITAFAAIVPLSYFHPGLFLGLLFCALSVALSRILLGMHFFSDVVAGGLIGGLLGWASVLAWELT